MSKNTKILCYLGSALLIAMAAFHGSGYSFFRAAVIESNASEFLKQIIPALFVHPSLHLIALAAFGTLATFMERDARKVLVLLSILIAVDAVLGFWLGGILPGSLLLAAALCFGVAGARQSSG